MEIDRAAIAKSLNMIAGHLWTNVDNMQEAFERFDDTLTVAIPLKFSVKFNKLHIEAGIRFVTDKIEEKSTGTIEKKDRQVRLPFGGSIDPDFQQPPRPRRMAGSTQGEKTRMRARNGLT